MDLSSAHLSPRIIFITGTDTGVGKTLLTGLLLCHLRQSGVRALALKPFCSGSRSDATLLQVLQDRELTLDQINPFYFREPLAPLAAARKHHCRVELKSVLSKIGEVIRRLASAHENIPAAACCSRDDGGSKRPKGAATRSSPACLLIEGAGGLLVPLGEGFTVLDLISALSAKPFLGRVRPNLDVIVVGANKLGTINHTLLTTRALRSAGIVRVKAVLMGQKVNDASANSNPQIIADLVAPAPVFTVPFLGADCSNPRRIFAHQRKLNPTLKNLATPFPAGVKEG